jgi:hypothetical protein
MSDYFVPTSREKFAGLLNTFGKEMPNYGSLLGFTKDEEDEAVADAAYMGWIVRTEGIYADFASGFSTFYREARYQKTDLDLVAPPVPVIDTMPAVVKSGIQARFAQKVRKAKASANYTESIGKALGIVSDSSAARINATDKPELKVILNGGYPELSFKLSGYEAVNIYRDAGSGYVILKTAHRSPLKDTLLPAAGQTALYKYKAMYVENDVETGAISAEVSIAVAGR